MLYLERSRASSRTSSCSFPPGQVTFHVPYARLDDQGLGYQDPWPRSASNPWHIDPVWSHLQVVSLLVGGSTLLLQAEPAWFPLAKPRPPGARLQAQAPSLLFMRGLRPQLVWSVTKDLFSLRDPTRGPRQPSSLDHQGSQTPSLRYGGGFEREYFFVKNCSF